MQTTAVNLISGALGSGKTTLLKHLLFQKPSNEKWVLLVNEFGAIDIDGAILGSTKNAQTIQMPGGCICCTALTELQNTLTDVIETEQPDRILIEPTGLAEPDTIIDILTSADLKSLLHIETLIAVLDANFTTISDLEQMTIFQSLLNMSDIVVINKTDIASQAQTSILEEFCDQLYPPKLKVLSTQQGNIDLKDLKHPHFQKQTYRFSLTQKTLPPYIKHLDTPSIITEPKELPFNPIQLRHLEDRIYQISMDTQSLGWVFNHQAEFDWKKIFSAFEDFRLDSSVLRAKGIFKVGRPRMLFQYVNEQATRDIIAYRKDSRIELLLSADSKFDLSEFEQKLFDAMKP